MSIVEGPGITRYDVPGNTPPYNIDLRHGPVGTQGNLFASTIAGPGVHWAEAYLPTADAYRFNGDPSLKAQLTDIATTGAADQRQVASTLLYWAERWLYFSGNTAASPSPDPVPVVAPGVVPGLATPYAQLPPLPTGAPVTPGTYDAILAAQQDPAALGSSVPISSGAPKPSVAGGAPATGGANPLENAPPIVQEAPGPKIGAALGIGLALLALFLLKRRR